jgi:hypothetical protein
MLHQYESILATNDPRSIPISLSDDGPMRQKHVAGNKYSIVRY